MSGDLSTESKEDDSYLLDDYESEEENANTAGKSNDHPVNNLSAASFDLLNKYVLHSLVRNPIATYTQHF